MRSVQKTRVKPFRLSFSTGGSSRNSQSKKVESKKPFFDCVRKPDLGFSRKRPFSTDKSDRIRIGLIRPFLIQSDSASRKQPFSTGHFVDRILLILLLIVSRVDFIVFVLFLEAVGVREYCCMAVENRLAALCFARSSRATRASCATNLCPSGLVALGSAESRQSYVRGIALSREPPKLQQA